MGNAHARRSGRGRAAAAHDRRAPITAPSKSEPGAQPPGLCVSLPAAVLFAAFRAATAAQFS